MAEILDCIGLRCPQPVLKIAMKTRTIPAGSSIEVRADCESFTEDIKKWCEDCGKVLVSCVDQGDFTSATIQF
jgi:tRNA 2-thiouridine synthesizing protein A